jgi:hypothetical protein
MWSSRIDEHTSYNNNKKNDKRNRIENDSHDAKRNRTNNTHAGNHTTTTTATTAATLSCNHCGRTNHTAASCAAKFHPDHNPDASVPWAASASGIAFKAKGLDILPFKSTLSGDVLQLPSALAPKNKSTNGHNKCKCDDCNNITHAHTSDTNTDTISCHIHIYNNDSTKQQEIKCDALIDTGALRADYISVHKAKEISSITNTKINTTNVTKTCTPFMDMCSNTLGTIDAVIDIFDETINNYEHIPLTFKVIDMKYDMIIGKPTIRKYDLTQKCRSQFIDPNKNNNTTTNLALRNVREVAIEAAIIAGRRRVRSPHANKRQRNTKITPSVNTPEDINTMITTNNSDNLYPQTTHNCYCDNITHTKHTLNVFSYWAASGEPLLCSKQHATYTDSDNTVDSSNKHKRYKNNNINTLLSEPAISTAGGSGGNRFGRRPTISSDSSVLTCCALDGQDSTNYLRQHIHQIIGKNTDVDELTKEKERDNELSPWDIYDTENTNNSEDVIPAKVQSHVQRHHELFIKYKHLFRRTVNKEPALLPALTLSVDDDLWHCNRHRLPPRPQSEVKEKVISEQSVEMLNNNVITYSQATEWSQVTLAPKPNGKWRFCIDYKYLNLVTKGMGFPIPLIAQIVQRISRKKAKYYAVIDLTSGYHQAPLAQESRKYTAFRTLNALFEWLRIPFGLKGAPAWFQFIMATIVLANILYICCELYLDDILIFGSTEDEYFYNLEQVFLRLDKHKLTANPDKGQFGMTEVDYVGHHFTQVGVTHNKDRIQKVLDIPQPKYAKQLKSFIGVAEYFHDHIRNFATLLQPLRALITPYVRTHNIQWTDEAIESFNTIKDEINNCPTLYFIDSDSPIYLHTDASDYGIGAYLFQLIDNNEKPVMFMSKSLSTSEMKWSTIDKEAYAIVYALYKFKHL